LARAGIADQHHESTGDARCDHRLGVKIIFHMKELRISPDESRGFLCFHLALDEGQ
jgi:hypothetical protein